MYLRTACCCIALSTLFFSDTAAQDTKYFNLKTCSETPTQSDPSMVSRKSILAPGECGEGRPVKLVIVDRWYGFESPTMTVRDIPAKPSVIRPMNEDVFKTHKPCRSAYPEEGVVAEWLIPRTAECGGLPSGAYYRVYTPHNEICIRPKGSCVSVDSLDEVGQKRFRSMLRIAYENY